MITSSRIVIGTLAGFLIIVAGLSIGFYFSRHGLPSLPSSDTAREEPNFTTYDISPPSRATTIETKEIEVHPAGNIAFVMMPKKEAGEIKTGQKILLYDANGALLDTLGEVSAIKEGTDMFKDMVTVHMILHSDEQVNAGLAVRGNIVVNRIPDSPRLPLSALVKNDKGESYIWEAVENEDGTTTAYYKRANVASANYDFFVIDQTTPQGGIYILNPDNKLRDGQKINVRKTMYAGPMQTDDSRIEQLIKNRQRDFASRAAMQQALDSAPGGGTGAPSGAAANCAIPPDAAKDFMKKVKELGSSKPVESLPSEKAPAP